MSRPNWNSSENKASPLQNMKALRVAEGQAPNSALMAVGMSVLHVLRLYPNSIRGETARNICAVYGNNAIGETTERTWFSRFKESRFDISDTPRSGRPLEFDEDRLNTLIHNDPRQCTLELANVMNCDIPPSCDICI
ncbi:hypothetical protein ANN_15319 [Periplaneta americana]|uniref:Mos1 transposase HTH domain-containing protein n=1 Tax=Periplaneta americana TaxID=6978 RepID=A0ABQ8SG29_PERAM|nr:hypothetical protein ANN_15319 [Periplaneta americana]